ncbi:helix-turn-helix transcriptional regulator [Brevibacillus humidisoli]|uniref:helix-turn-helix transcriptional regulator n=1 Tax=Brevibacillus humidisoli TaxID=2895522 RepID=UPI001E3689FD|nr:helix-turn-helix transcriptional regulator [Brevibacillus humidisoli]UFJ40298.1 helix-turn-helix transcriptional regulator [Brevibacillus humidisoli]
MAIGDFGELIRTYRRQVNITASELAKRAGIPKSVLSKIETGETKRPSFETCKKIASTLNIPDTLVISSYLDVTEHAKSIQVLLQEAIALKNKVLVEKVAQRLLETPKMDTFLALDLLFQVTRDVADHPIRLTLYNVMIDYTRKRGVPYYLGKCLYERYLLERDDFSRFEETYRGARELLHYIDYLQPTERISFYYRLGIHANILGYHRECIELCGKGIRQDRTDSKQKASALIALFNSYIALGDLTFAEYCLKQYEDCEYADFRKKHFQAALYTMKGQYDEAVHLYKECLYEAERDGRISIASDLLEIYMVSGRNDAIKELIQAEDQFLPADVDGHPYRINVAARYFQQKGMCQLSIGLTDEGFNSLLQSISFYRKLGASEKVIECVGLFLKHHRIYEKNLSFEHMELIVNICYDDN